VGGALVDAAGPASAFILAGVAGLAAAAVATTLGRTVGYAVRTAR